MYQFSGNTRLSVLLHDLASHGCSTTLPCRPSSNGTVRQQHCRHQAQRSGRAIRIPRLPQSQAIGQDTYQLKPDGKVLHRLQGRVDDRQYVVANPEPREPIQIIDAESKQRRVPSHRPRGGEHGRLHQHGNLEAALRVPCRLLDRYART